MIRGMHGMFYSSKPSELRAFLRDKLKFSFTDTGGGWLIFDLPEADLGVHPSEGDPELTGRHDLSFYTDDIEGTVAELKGRGVKFDDEITDRGYGIVTHFTMPGGVQVQLYQPRYQKKSAKAKRPAKKSVKAARA